VITKKETLELRQYFHRQFINIDASDETLIKKYKVVSFLLTYISSADEVTSLEVLKKLTKCAELVKLLENHPKKETLIYHNLKGFFCLKHAQGGFPSVRHLK